jgi:hypothetical protein
VTLLDDPSHRICAGEHPLKAWREFCGLEQADLSPRGPAPSFRALRMSLHGLS